MYYIRQLNEIYLFLERAEKEKDLESASALRWAIFNLEQLNKQSEGGIKCEIIK